MVEKSQNHFYKVLACCVSSAFLAGYIFASDILVGGRPAQVVQVERLESAISGRIGMSNMHFRNMEDNLSTITLSLERIAYALEVQAGIE